MFVCNKALLCSISIENQFYIKIVVCPIISLTVICRFYIRMGFDTGCNFCILYFSKFDTLCCSLNMWCKLHFFHLIIIAIWWHMYVPLNGLPISSDNVLKSYAIKYYKSTCLSNSSSFVYFPKQASNYTYILHTHNKFCRDDKQKFIVYQAACLRLLDWGYLIIKMLFYQYMNSNYKAMIVS